MLIKTTIPGDALQRALERQHRWLDRYHREGIRRHGVKQSGQIDEKLTSESRTRGLRMAKAELRREPR